MSPLSNSDLAGAAASLLLLAGYYAFLWFMSRRNPLYTSQAMNARIRLHWVEGVLRNNKDLLAIHTLRNSTMAATLLASTSVVFVMGLLNMISKDDPFTVQNGYKLIIILLDLFIAFFSFAMSIRIYHHVGYMLGLPPVSAQPAMDPERVANQLNRGAAFYSHGMRAFYWLIPLVFWFLGPSPLVIATAGTVVLLFSYDRAVGEGS